MKKNVKETLTKQEIERRKRVELLLQKRGFKTKLPPALKS